MLDDILQTETHRDKHVAFDQFTDTPEARIQKTTECLPRNRDERTNCLNGNRMLLMMYRPGRLAEESWHERRGSAHLADVAEGVDLTNSIRPSSQNQAAA